VRQVPPGKFAARRAAARAPWAAPGALQLYAAMPVRDMAYHKKVRHSRYCLSLSVRQCWHAHPERSLQTCKRLCKEFTLTYTTLSGETPSRPWAFPVRRKSLSVARKLDAESLQHLKQVVDENPRLFLDEIALKIKNDCGVILSEAAVCRNLMASKRNGGLGYTLKKLSRLAVQKDYAERRDFLHIWLGFYRDLYHTALVLDERHGDENVARRAMGWAPRGEQAYVFEPFKESTSFSLLAVANQDGFCPHMCYISQEPVTSELFVDYFRVFVHPYLRPLGEPNGLLLLDNVSQHWDPRIREMCEDKGCQILYLPRYSPEFSPIELAFGWLKKRCKRQTSQLSRAVVSGSVLVQFVYDCLPQLDGSQMRKFCGKCFWKLAQREKQRSHGAHHSISKRDCEHVLRVKTCKTVSWGLNAPPSCVARLRPASSSFIVTF
jgi:transposase